MQVKHNILPAAAADAVPASPPAVEAAQRGEALSQRATAADCLLLRWAQAAHALHCAGLAGQALAAELHRLWAYEEKASQHVKLPPHAREVRPPSPWLARQRSRVGHAYAAMRESAGSCRTPRMRL